MLFSSFVSNLTIKKVSLGKDNHGATWQPSNSPPTNCSYHARWNLCEHAALHLGIRNMDFICCSFNYVLLPSPPLPPPPIPLRYIFAILRLQVTLSRCCVKLHCRIVLWTLLLLSLANTTLQRIPDQNFLPQNSPIVQFDTTPTQSPAQP